ncbi:MAG: hypothetical protein P2A85_29085 (plasmid) [Microcoleus anatoxicus]|uniref:hypothetical protein n=1 Tax=Microcoleus anatoxicus TaxID=2705319 RepID=UPI0036734270
MNKEDYEAKDRAFYSAMISAWLNTKLERDKQLLTLSTSAIGLLVTLLRTVGVSNFSQILLFGAALIAFLFTVISVIWILGKNANHIEQMLNGYETESRQLAFLDLVATISFVIGMVMVVIIGMYSATISLIEKGTNMNQDNIVNIHRESVKTNNDSWNGVHKLRPQPPKAVETNSTTTPNASNPSASSGGSGSGNTGKPDGSS